MIPILLLTFWAAPATASTSTAAAELPAFGVDPLGDAGTIGASLAFGVLLELIIRTGELRPQEPTDPSVLLAIDRPTALKDEPEPSGSLLSNLGVGLAAAYAVADIAAATILDRGESPIAYLLMYAESAVVNFAVTDLVKIAVRRPRPLAYRELRQTGMVSSDTNSALAFYSGHTSICAGLAATASYLAFERDPLEGWIVTGVGVALTALVGYQRVRSGAHFPTDVIAGGLAGASIGLLVPHLHRIGPSMKIAMAPFEDGAMATVGGVF